MHDDELIAALRARAADPGRRLEAQVSAFGMDVASMGLGQMLASLRDLQGDLARLLEDPLHPPADLQEKAASFGERMQQPAEQPLPAPAAEADVLAAEAAIGAPLPPLLRRLYTEVADGGFGPGYGLLGVGPGGWTDDHRRGLVAVLRANQEGAADLPEGAWRWPSTLLPIAYLGDVIYACADLARPGTPVLEYDPSDLDWDEDGYPLDEEEALVEVSPTLAGWLEAWLASPSAAEQHEAAMAGADEAMKEQLKLGWSIMTPEARAELGITDWHLETGELPDSWR